MDDSISLGLPEVESRNQVSEPSMLEDGSASPEAADLGLERVREGNPSHVPTQGRWAGAALREGSCRCRTLETLCAGWTGPRIGEEWGEPDVGREVVS